MGKHPGITVRHGRACASRTGGRCGCKPTFEAWVYSRRDRRKISKRFSSKTEAKIWRADALAQMSRGKLRAPVRLTLAEAAEEWLEQAREDRIRTRSGKPYKPSTLRGYERSLRRRVVPALGAMRLSEVRRLDIQDFADSLLAEGLDASSVVNTLDPLRAIYRRAVQREQVVVNPSADLDLPRPAGSRERIITPAEAVELVAALPERDKALWATAIYAGLRRGELRALRWDHIDLEAREIRVEASWDDREGEVGGKSEAAKRTVPILGRLAAFLAAEKLRSGRSGASFVFGATADRPFEPSTVRRHALAAWKCANLEPITLHEARHTCASILIAARVDAKTIQTIMGHASITMTYDTYGHLMPDSRQEAVRRADVYLGDRNTLEAVE